MFTRFVGIDWSGANGRWQAGIAVAVADAGASRPKLMPGPGPDGRWSRAEVAAFIVEEAARAPTLFGLDFAFGFPLNPDGSCWEWEHAETWSGGAENFYGGAFFRDLRAPHADLVNAPGRRGVGYRASLLRLTDRRAALLKGCTPQSVFNAVGAAQVGPSSISGMRLLRALRSQGAPVSIWPFEPLRDGGSALVEVFPRYLAIAAGGSPTLRDRDNLNAALVAHGSQPVDAAPRNEDEGDALLAAAALRWLAAPERFMVPHESARREGWIFGVRF